MTLHNFSELCPQVVNLQIRTHPQGQIRLFGEEAKLSVETTATGADIAYQWIKDGKRINDGHNVCGGKTDTLVINCFTLEYEGEYKCAVQNQSKTVESNPAKLQLNRKSYFFYSLPAGGGLA